MTERLAEAVRRIESLRQLDAVVGAMRGIAASRAVQARGLLRGVQAYAAVVGSAIGEALAIAPETTQDAPPTTHPLALILFVAEQGFAGAFSERMLESAASLPPGSALFLIGTRGAALAEERGLRLTWRAPMVPQAALIPALADRIAEALYAWLADRRGARVELFVPVWSPPGGVAAERRTLVPFDYRRFPVTPGRPPPLVTLSPARLLAHLAAEYVFAELCEAALTAFAAENEARVACMLAAGTNLDGMRAELDQLARQLRQEEITAEVVELAGGAAGAR